MNRKSFSDVGVHKIDGRLWEKRHKVNVGTAINVRQFKTQHCSGEPLRGPQGMPTESRCSGRERHQRQGQCAQRKPDGGTGGNSEGTTFEDVPKDTQQQLVTNSVLGESKPDCRKVGRAFSLPPQERKGRC